MEKSQPLTDDGKARCANCRFFNKIGGGNEVFHVCAYNPPHVTHVMAPQQGMGGMELVWKSFSGWPVTQDDRWCGKHERVKH